MSRETPKAVVISKSMFDDNEDTSGSVTAGRFVLDFVRALLIFTIVWSLKICFPKNECAIDKNLLRRALSYMQEMSAIRPSPSPAMHIVRRIDRLARRNAGDVKPVSEMR